MPWTRGGDTAATYPDLMRVAGHDPEDDRLLNEVAGFVFRCYFQVALHTTDYVVDPGTAMAIGMARWRELVAHAVRAGLMTELDVEGIKHWQLKFDPEFFHVRTKAEIAWDRQRRKDLDKESPVRVQVLLRDGDQCRWCGVVVHWTGPLTNRTGVLDHLMPPEKLDGRVEPARPETMVVACAACNQGRGADVHAWDSGHDLRPEPAAPIYGAHTAGFLTRRGWPVDLNNLSDDDRGKTPAAADTAPQQGVRPAPADGARRQRSKAAADTAPRQGVRPAAPAAADPAPSQRATRSATPPTPESRPSPAGVSDSHSSESDLPGSGREGSVTPTTGDAREGATSPGPRPAPPRQPQPQQTSPAPRRKRRGKRGGSPRRDA